MTDESAEELNQKLDENHDKAAKIQAEMGLLSQRRKQALVAGTLSASVDLKQQIQRLQDALDDLIISKNSIEGRLRNYTKNMPEATKIRDIVNERWEEEARPLGDEFCKMQSRARVLYGKALEIDRKNSEDANEHRRLVGREMRGPPSITGTVYQLATFAASNVPDIKLLDAWQYLSDEQIAAQRKDELEKKLKAHEERIKIAESAAAPCPSCGSKMIVDRASGPSDRPGEGPYFGHSPQWNVFCTKCHMRQTQAIAEAKTD